MPRIKISGYFNGATKESKKVLDAAITTGFLAGQCFRLASGAGDAYSHNEVEVCDTAGESVFGIVLESSTDYDGPSGMNIPSSSKVTILHGHAEFFIDHEAEVAAATFASGTCAYEYGATFVLNAPLFVNASGKLSPTVAAYSGSLYLPVAKTTQIPSAANDYTLGVLLLG